MYLDDVCVLMGIDWMNESFDWNEDVIEADIATLPEVVTAGLEGWEQCVEDTLAQYDDNE